MRKILTDGSELLSMLSRLFSPDLSYVPPGAARTQVLHDVDAMGIHGDQQVGRSMVSVLESQDKLDEAMEVSSPPDQSRHPGLTIPNDCYLRAVPTERLSLPTPRPLCVCAGKHYTTRRRNTSPTVFDQIRGHPCFEHPTESP